MNNLNKSTLDRVLNRHAMDSVVGGMDPNEMNERARQNAQRMLYQERRRLEQPKREVSLGNGFYLGGDDLIEYRKGNHKIGYTPNRVTYTKNTDCVIL